MNGGRLNAQGLCKSYKEKEVLHNLDLTIEPGKIYGLIGRNGAGKTTLLGILTAQNTKNSGEVTYNGQPVWENQRALNDICFSREMQATVSSGVSPSGTDSSTSGTRTMKSVTPMRSSSSRRRGEPEAKTI